MVDRLEMAKQYVQEMLETRDDIVGAFVVGSVARGEATEASDIDLGLIIRGQEGDKIIRGGADAWRDGVYIEVGLEPENHYDDPGKVLRNRVAATHMNDALILYDPTGQFANVQAEVRSRYMKPEWLGLRVHHQLRMLQHALTTVRESVTQGDPLGVFWYVPMAMWTAAVPLLINGVTPSSTRGLIQVAAVAPGLQERVFEWEGSTRMSLDDVVSLMPLTSQCLALQRAAGDEEWGQAYDYFDKKARWYAAQGSHRIALHLMGFLPGGMADAAIKTEDPEFISKAGGLARAWLHAVGWEGQEVLEEKVRMAEEMVAEVAAMAAHLPSGGDAETR